MIRCECECYLPVICCTFNINIHIINDQFWSDLGCLDHSGGPKAALLQIHSLLLLLDSPDQPVHPVARLLHQSDCQVYTGSLIHTDVPLCLRLFAELLKKLLPTLIQLHHLLQRMIKFEVFLPRKEQPVHLMNCLFVSQVIEGLTEQVIGGHWPVVLHDQVLWLTTSKANEALQPLFRPNELGLQEG